MGSLALLLLLFPSGLKGGGSPARPASLRGFKIYASYFTFRSLWMDKKPHALHQKIPSHGRRCNLSHQDYQARTLSAGRSF